ncbi:MAG TPA: glutaredoxin family protein [Thiobacillaceae bacterium]|nr:glutaredoxin family protein [Thiobacillaceae bacterium]
MKTGWMMMAACLLATSAPLGAAGLYQWKDAQGRTVYSDQPPPARTTGVQQKNFKGSVIEVGESYAARVAREKHPVTLYTSTCGSPCDQAKQLLATRGIPHTAHNLGTNEAARTELEQLTGKLNVPVLRVGSEKLEGFEASRWQDALDRAGYPKAASPGSAQAPAR